MTTGKLDHKVHVAAEGLHFAPVGIIAIRRRGRRSLQVRKRRAGVVAFLCMKQWTQLNPTGDDDLWVDNDVANTTDERVVIDAIFRSAFRTNVRLKITQDKRSDLPSSPNLDHISGSQCRIVFCEMGAFIGRFLRAATPSDFSLHSKGRPQRTLPWETQMAERATTPSIWRIGAISSPVHFLLFQPLFRVSLLVPLLTGLEGCSTTI